MFRTAKAQTWKTILVILIAPIVLGGTRGAATSVEPTPAAQRPAAADYPKLLVSDTVTVHAQTSAQVDLALWALDVYAGAGLELPHIQMWMGSDTSQCIHPNGDRVRGFATWRDGDVVLFHCGDAFTMLHELAHVYDRHALTDEQRDDFLKLRGLEHWQDTSAWALSGEEHYANAVAWGLDKDARREFHTAPVDTDSMMEAFELVLGFEA